MNQSSKGAYKRSLIALLPMLIILGTSGWIAYPDLEELRKLRSEETEARIILRKAEGLRPEVDAHDTEQGQAIAIVNKWLNVRMPETNDPRSFFAEIRLAELRSEIELTACSQVKPGRFDFNSSQDEMAAGSYWNLQARGTYEQLIAFMHILRQGDRLYIIDRFRLMPAVRGGLEASIRIFVPGLLPGQTIEENEQ